MDAGISQQTQKQRREGTHFTEQHVAEWPQINRQDFYIIR